MWSSNNINGEQKTNLTSKVLNWYRNFSKIKTPYQYKTIIKNLSNNKDIGLLKQDKGRGIVIMDIDHYIEKA